MTNTAESQTQALVVVDPDDVAFLKQLVSENGVTAQEVDQDNFLDPLTVSFILLGSTAAVGTVTYLLDRRKGGQVFDLRKDAPRAEYRSKDIQYGLVKIVSADGKVTVEVKEPRGLIGQVIDAIKGIITEVAGAGTKSVAEAVKGALAAVAGDQATVSTEVAK